ncbi:MAG: acyl carrier protein [Spirochaetales bacterium]|nr:acyl carrier protein [Spirochaetales bacterium]
MSIDETFRQIEDVFREIFEDDDLVITTQTTARDIEEWDSLMNIQLVTAIEKKFKIRFTLGEIQNFKNVGDLQDCVIKRLG